MSMCSFCGKNLERGTGKMFVKTDGSIMFFCGRKCERNSEIRDKKKVPWTAEFRKLKQRRLKVAETSGVAAKVESKPAAAKEAKPSKK